MRRRPKLLSTVEYLIVLQDAAKARLVAEGNERIDDSNYTAAQEVLDDHLSLSEHLGAKGGGSSRPREEPRGG